MYFMRDCLLVGASTDFCGEHERVSEKYVNNQSNFKSHTDLTRNLFLPLCGIMSAIPSSVAAGPAHMLAEELESNLFHQLMQGRHSNYPAHRESNPNPPWCSPATTTHCPMKGSFPLPSKSRCSVFVSNILNCHRLLDRHVLQFSSSPAP